MARSGFSLPPPDTVPGLEGTLRIGPEPEEELGPEVPRPTYLWPRWLFLRLLGICFFIGFISIWVQAEGLIGPGGVYPVNEYLDSIAEKYLPGEQQLKVPTLLWLDVSTPGMDVLFGLGLVSAALLILNVWPQLALIACWVFYLSFVAAGRELTNLQSDRLLLESAFIGIFLAPSGARPGVGIWNPPSDFAIFAMRWLLFRLMLGSGLGALLSGDPHWWELTAMDDFYQNTPFPTQIGWWMAQLGHSFHAATTVFILVVEIAGAFVILLPRIPRIVLFCVWTILNLWMLLAASDGFVGYLAIGIALMLLDDRLLTGRLKFRPVIQEEPPLAGGFAGFFALGFLLYLTAIPFLFQIGLPRKAIHPDFRYFAEQAQTFRSTNTYRLFADIPEWRAQVEFRGSDDDGVTWKTYAFRWQPQSTNVPPRFLGPHIPRLEAGLHAAAHQTFDESSIALETGLALIEGDPAVVALFADNPFPKSRPKMMAFRLFDYGFTDVETLEASGDYWEREEIGEYGPAVSFDQRGWVHLGAKE